YQKAFDLSLTIIDQFYHVLDFSFDFFTASIESKNESKAIETLAEFDKSLDQNPFYEFFVSYLLLAADKPLLAQQRISNSLTIRAELELDYKSPYLKAFELLIHARTLHSTPQKPVNQPLKKATTFLARFKLINKAAELTDLWPSIEPLLEDKSW